MCQLVRSNCGSFPSSYACLGTLKNRSSGSFRSGRVSGPSSAYCSSSSILLCPPARYTSPMAMSPASEVSAPAAKVIRQPSCAACGGRLIRNFPSSAMVSPRASSFPAASVRAAETHTPSAASPNRRISFPRHRTAPSVNSADGFSFFSIWLAYPLFFRYSRFFRISSARCRTQSGLRSGSSGVLNT